ncbi:MAG TPA: metalloregulator ArsR/SmtB family transcription factor [Azospirillum sp.]|nr:metalloregulator ArsR/SmtB family transcription factor [Azospirillum sp.]
MEQKPAIAALAALAQDSRLEVFRLLVRQGPDGLPAGAIAERLGVQPATLSFHLAQLSHAGLVTSRRQGRSIIYSADVTTMKDLMSFLLHDCCSGHPELCGVGGAAAPAEAPRCAPAQPKAAGTA